MKIPVSCAKCSREKLHIGERHFITPELNDLNIYTFTCLEGHNAKIMRAEEKYEFLFEHAIHALLKGSYRDSISSFINSLESFYEFSIDVISRSNGISSSLKEIKSMKLSERKLGAFIISFLHKFKQSPKTLSDDKTKLRNDVLHSGKFPTYQETLDFGSAVLEVINSNLAFLKESYMEEITKLNLERQEVQYKEAVKNTDPENICTMSDAIFFNTNNFNNSIPQIDIEEYLDMMKRVNEY